MWKPSINRHTANKVQTLLYILKKDISSGHLVAGEQLPTQDELVEHTGIAKSTIARAYQAANSEKLINTVVGKGSFVAGKSDPFFQAVDHQCNEMLDLRIDYPLYAFDPLLSETLAQISKEDCQHLLSYQDHSGHIVYREAGLRWLHLNGVDCVLEQVSLTGGSQHAITVCLSSIAEAGEAVVVEELTYPGIRETALMLGITLIPVRMDEDGVIPEALENILFEHKNVKAFYTLPTVHNPTTILTPEYRRREIADICRKHRIFIVEDDIQRLFSDEQPVPYANLLPELTFFIAGISKVISGGLRIAYVSAPKETVKTVRRRLLATYWTLPPLMAEIATRWINDGTALATLKAKKEEAKQRQLLVQKLLGSPYVVQKISSYYTWVELSSEWSSETFINEAHKNGVALLGTGTFQITQHSGQSASQNLDQTFGANGVRLCLGAASNQKVLERGLKKISELLKDGPSSAIGVL
ncbi:PLP-dependent aminotransferase family protein [Kiloniella antarctica]|uniref:PLP-dependent aminotransferase family protein n=1 Tax=Kiloniella antarctica TaxID=1550907 RepID=A0ABW5BKH3_9PROT